MNSFSEDLETMALYKNYAESSITEQLKMQVYISVLVVSIFLLIVAFCKMKDFLTVSAFPVSVDEKEERHCCLCSGPVGKYGNNAEPLMEEGMCCDSCNVNKVVPARLQMDASDSQEEEEDSEYDDMPPLIDVARPLEPTQNHLRARLKLRNPLNLPPTSHFYKALNGLQSIELNVSQVKEELLSAKLETEYVQANNSRKME